MPQGNPSAQADTKPTPAVKLKLSGIPNELKKHDRWILWKYTKIVSGDREKWTKTPHSLNGHKVDATNLDNGSSFVNAVQALKSSGGKFDGLGFLLGGGIAGIDVDDCIDEDGNLDDRGQMVSAAYRATYAEVSPSGRGFKVLVNIGDDPKLALIGKNSGGMEIYGGRRYFTVTGAMLPGHVAKVASLPEAFTRTAEQMGISTAAKQAASPGMPVKRHLGIDMKAARELLDHLPFRWCDEYGDWLRAGMALHHEFDGDDQALALWDEWSQRSSKYAEGVCAGKWPTFGKPGKDEVTMRTLVRDAQSTGWRAPATIDRAIRDFTAFDEDHSDESSELDWWSRYSVGPLLSEDVPPKEWLWQGVLRAGKVMVLAGSGGSSKSYLMLGSAIQYALGNDWGPFVLPPDTTPGRTLLVYAEEDHLDVHDRVHTFRHTFMLSDEQIQTVAGRVAVLPLRGKDVELARYEDSVVVMTDQLAKLEARIAQYGIKLVILDPLAMLHTLEENDNGAIAALIRGLDAMCIRTGAALVIIHHFGKSTPIKAREVNESNVRGASALVAHARTVVVMHRMREDEAPEWGIIPEEHARWVMFAIAKNNYGPTGQRYWFNVDPHNGALSPAPAQLTYLNTATLRQAAAAHALNTEATEFSETQARLAREQAAEEIAMVNRMRVLLRYAQREGRLPPISRSHTVLQSYSIPTTPRKARSVVERIRNEQLVDTDGLLTEAGQDWLEAREMLE